MKVVLTAFNQKLISEPMDYPENTPHEIRIIMDLDLKPTFTEEDYYPKLTRKVGVFVSTSRPVWIDKIECREYKLVEII